MSVLDTDLSSNTEKTTPYENFIFALKAKESIRQYPKRLDQFLNFLGWTDEIPEKCKKMYDLAKNNRELFQSHLMRFTQFQKERIERKEIVEGTLRNYFKAIRLFCQMNEIDVSWKKISKGIPSETTNSDDRVPDLQEIKQLLEYPDIRLKPIVLVMLSSGIRVGSWDHLKWKHVIPIHRDGVLVAAKLILTNTKIKNRTYYGFITPEAYNALKSYMDFRKMHGENITGESWLIRDTWQKVDRKHGHRIGLAQFPKKLSSNAIRNLVYHAWKIQGLRTKLDDPTKKRHEFKTTHFARKFFETKTQKVMNHNNIKLLMDHSMGESKNYYRPTEDELLGDYLKAVDLLTIDETQRLRQEVQYYQIERSKIDGLTAQIEEMKKKLGLNF